MLSATSFAKLNIVPLSTDGLRNDKCRAAIALYLRPLMCIQSILHCQIMQTELLLYFIHKRRFRLPEPQPYKRIGVLDVFADILNIYGFGRVA